MEHTIETISTKRFLLIGLLPTPLIVGIPIWLAVAIDSFALIGLLLPLFAAALFCAFRFSRRISHITVEDTHFSIDGKRIDFNSVDGYHVNDIGLVMDSLDIRLKNGETASITGWKSGEKGEAFRELTNCVITAMKSDNYKSEELAYQHVHVKQMKVMRPLIYIAIPVVIALNAYLIYLKVTDDRTLPWQIFFLNFLLLGMIPYLKKRK